MAISNFNIVFNQKALFKPGDEISGKVIMDVWATIEVKYVELLIMGKGTVREFSKATFGEKPRFEDYIDKRLQLIGPKNGGYFVTLKPGRYVSSFNYTLPETLPPTVHQFEMGQGYLFDISYCVQANVCDSASSKYASGSKNLTKVIKAVRKPFRVLPQHDWHSYSGALEPINHTEEVSLMCVPQKSEPTSVTLNLARGVYAVGDVIELTSQVFCPERRKVRSITAALEQQLSFNSEVLGKFRETIVSATDDRHFRIFIGQEHTMSSHFKLHMPHNLVPSYLPNCNMVRVEYNVTLSVKFKKFGGNLHVKIPIVIMAAGRREAGNQDSDLSTNLPVFNKPIMQFPFFSGKPDQPSSESESDHSHTTLKSNRSEKKNMLDGHQDIDVTLKGQITTKYEPYVVCPGCCLGCMGVGIHDN